MLYHYDQETDYILAYTLEIPGYPSIKSTDRSLISPMGSDCLFDQILEEMVHSRLDTVILKRGDVQITIQSKCLILPKRPPLGPREEEINRLRLGPL